MEKEILKLIEDSSRIIIITHVNPDGDTLGCASALKSFIGKKADILIQINDNFNFPNTYSFLPYINKSKNLSNLENINSVLINEQVPQTERLVKLNQIAIYQSIHQNLLENDRRHQRTRNGNIYN